MMPPLEVASARALDAIVEAAYAARFIIAIAIVDAHGDLVAARRMDGAHPRWMRASIRKAYSAAVMDRDTEEFHRELVQRQVPIAYYGDPGLTALRGGVVVPAPDGTTVVGIGVTGKTLGRDSELARAGAAAFGV
jgi:glc operon protein GlcG